MRSVRLIPCLDVTGGRVVKGVRFVDLTDEGDPVELAARYDAEGADEVTFLDITASSDEPRHHGRRWWRARPSRSSSPSRWGVGSGRRRMHAASSGPGRTRSR